LKDIFVLIPVPVLILALAASARRMRTLTGWAAVLMWAQLGIVLSIALPLMTGDSHSGAISFGFRLDRMASVFVALTTLVVAAAFTHAVGFFAREADSEHSPSLRALREFYGFAALFLLSMYAVITADNLGYLWIAVEATTLLSAPLVYFHRSHTALEATWKYLIICSVGIAFAFFGTAILYSASQRVAPLGEGSLSLTALIDRAKLLPAGLLRLGFVFILLGYGTKAGIFPLHTWLPDAHSEAPAPASAILSGALLNCALVALWRVCNLMFAAGQGAFVRVTLLPLGIATVVAASLFLLRQRDLKRMLAYSSVENVGIMAVAIALGTGSGFALQAVNHSLVKVAFFLLAGNLLQRYGTKTLRELRGVLGAYPSQGVLLLLAAVAVAGTPPFGSFLAEWQILSTAADARHIATVAVLCAALAVAFIALIVQIGGVVFGDALQDSTERDAASSFGQVAVPFAMLAASLVLGLMLPAAIVQGLAQ
jgi:hydrogenase-4 component F